MAVKILPKKPPAKPAAACSTKKKKPTAHKPAK